MAIHKDFDDYENMEQITSKLEKEGTFREKRRYPRIDYIFQVKYELLPTTDIKKQETETTGKDISLGGVSFQLEQDLKIGAFVILKLFIKELSGELKAMGKVVRTWEELDTNTNTTKKYCAIKFTAIDPTDYEIINQFIKNYNSQQKK